MIASTPYKLTLGFSPCPNDTFIFDALVNGRIDTEGLEFEVIMEDVETLNKYAFQEKLDITKLSFHAFSYLTNVYSLLDSGSALGKGCGPLLIARSKDIDLSKALVAIPGKYTTANFLFSLFAPNAMDKKGMLFSEIEGAVLTGKADAGVIIHENRFTYQDKGLVKIVDLGDFWEKKSGLPIPLGGIVIKKSLPAELALRVERLLKNSIDYAFTNPHASKSYIKQYAQEMNELVMQQHIDLYVNNYSLSLGDEGKRAVNELFLQAQKLNIIPTLNNQLFVG